jgi:hypothetical protein
LIDYGLSVSRRRLSYIPGMILRVEMIRNILL